ncbi:MAG: DUF1330 domain-containing protein [Candidatus Eisenbacteria bacterium]|nr:DUF1330 domain-containing protein [Candidatus Eisenbacteria bacterium]
MSAYVIVDIDVQDPAGYEEYKKLAPASIAAFGGRYIARGGQTHVLEGDWRPNRIVILEFDTVDQAQAWVTSEEYAPARKLRQATARASMIVVAGVD